MPLRWRHTGRDSVSNHQPHDCLLNRLFRSRSRKTSKLRVTGLCMGNSPGTGEFPAQMASNAENVSIWWRHHALASCLTSSKSLPEPTLTYLHCGSVSSTRGQFYRKRPRQQSLLCWWINISNYNHVFQEPIRELDTMFLRVDIIWITTPGQYSDIAWYLPTFMWKNITLRSSSSQYFITC